VKHIYEISIYTLVI